MSALRDRLQPWHGGAALVGLGFVYMLLALITGHEARAEAPEDLRPPPADLAVDVWGAAALLVEDGAAVLDVRGAAPFALAHIPGAREAAGADAGTIAAQASAGPLLVVAGSNEAAARLVQDARQQAPKARIHYLRDGMRPWFLALELPVPLFSKKPPPYGYAAALTALRAYITAPADAQRPAAAAALQTLARLNYQPDLLGQAKKAKTAKKRKKIAGGCG